MSKQTNEQQVNMIDEKTGKSISLSISQFAVKDEDGHNFNLNDAANELAAIQSRADKLSRDSESASRLMVQIAGKCGKPEVFRALCSLVEEQHKWGKAPKGTRAEEARLWQGSPAIWQNYKSKILKAMESGVMPGQKVKIQRKLRKPDAEGNTVKEETVTLDTVRNLETARKQAEDKEADAKLGTAPKAGVMVSKQGEVHTSQPLPETELGVMLAEVAELYKTVPEDMQAKAKDRIRRLIKDLEAAQPEQQEQAKAAAAG